MTVNTKDTNNKIQIELHVPDFTKVIDFYSKIGFKKIGNHDEEYLVMGRQGTLLNFWPGNDRVYEQSYFKGFPKDTKRGYGVEIVIPVDDVLDFHDKYKDFLDIVDPLVKRPWGLWDFRFVDPFGYYFRVTERNDITQGK